MPEGLLDKIIRGHRAVEDAFLAANPISQLFGYTGGLTAIVLAGVLVAESVPLLTVVLTLAAVYAVTAALVIGTELILRAFESGAVARAATRLGAAGAAAAAAATLGLSLSGPVASRPAPVVDDTVLAATTPRGDPSRGEVAAPREPEATLPGEQVQAGTLEAPASEPSRTRGILGALEPVK